MDLYCMRTNELILYCMRTDELLLHCMRTDELVLYCLRPDTLEKLHGPTNYKIGVLYPVSITRQSNSTYFTI